MSFSPSKKFVTLLLLSALATLSFVGSTSAVARAITSNSSGVQLFQKQQYLEAFFAFQAEAKRGLVQSQYNLAVMYNDGSTVNRDRVEALVWIQLAARSAKKAAFKANKNATKQKALAKRAKKYRKLAEEMRKGLTEQQLDLAAKK